MALATNLTEATIVESPPENARARRSLLRAIVMPLADQGK